MEEKIKLTEEEVDIISGGYIYDTGDKENEESRWQVIDKEGNVFKTFPCKVYAMEASKHNGFGTKIITTEQLQRLRETGSID